MLVKPGEAKQVVAVLVAHAGWEGCSKGSFDLGRNDYQWINQTGDSITRVERESVLGIRTKGKAK